MGCISKIRHENATLYLLMKKLNNYEPDIGDDIADRVEQDYRDYYYWEKIEKQDTLLNIICVVISFECGFLLSCYNEEELLFILRSPLLYFMFMFMLYELTCVYMMIVTDMANYFNVWIDIENEKIKQGKPKIISSYNPGFSILDIVTKRKKAQN